MFEKHKTLFRDLGPCHVDLSPLFAGPKTGVIMANTAFPVGLAMIFERNQTDLALSGRFSCLQNDMIHFLIITLRACNIST